MTDIDYSTPRNESECYVSCRKDFAEDIVKFVFTEYYFVRHIAEVIREMGYFIKTGNRYIFRRRKRFRKKNPSK